MKFLIVGTVKNPQFKRLWEEGEKRGHQVDGCHSYDLTINAEPKRFSLNLKDKKLSDYDLIYLWAFAKRRWEWLLAASYLQKKYQTKIVNRKLIDPTYAYYLTSGSEYKKQTESGINYPKSRIVFSLTKPERAAKGFKFPLIVKVSASRQGKGVFKVNSLTELKRLFEGFGKDAPALVIREFIPNNGDIRIFTVGYKAIGAMKRTPKTGDFRSNISQGGKGKVFNLKKFPEVKKMAEKLSKLTRTEIAGVDIMLHSQTKEPYVLEINPGPQFTGLEKYTSTNAALEIIKYFEGLVNSSPKENS